MTNYIVVSDTNIFIDLISIDLLESFFCLPFDFRTTDFVINEITDSKQKKELNKHIQTKKLIVKTFEVAELKNVIDLHKSVNTNASIQDCSVWYYSKMINAKLLTGDAKLKNVAIKDGLSVSGILFVFDMLVENKIITKRKAFEKLTLLLQKNVRLPFSECNSRLEKWSKDL